MEKFEIFEIAETIIQDFCNRQQNLIEREVSDYIDKNFVNVRDITLGDKNCVFDFSEYLRSVDMIRVLEKVHFDKNYNGFPPEGFSVFDTKTYKLTDNSNNKKYYICHTGKDTDRYQRAVALDFVKVCLADAEDDLSEYGFRIIGQVSDGHKIYNRWMRD